MRYPFAPRSRKFFESIPVEEGLASREVVGQTEGRLLNSLGRGRYEPHISELVEFSSFFAAALVASQDPVLASRFSKKEAERSRGFFIKEEPKSKSWTFAECFGSTLGNFDLDGRASYAVPFEGYLSLVSRYELGRNPKWKLARQELERGIVHVSDNMLNDLFGDCALAAIAEGVRNLRRAPFPKQLLGVKTDVLQYVPSPKPKTNRGYLYVETLLEHPVSDGRHRITWLILAPYCLPPDTLIPGDFRTIDSLSTGGLVIGREGQHQEVLKTFERPYDGSLMIVRASGMLPLMITPEHPVLTLATYPGALRRLGTGRALDVLGAARWKMASLLTPRTSYKKGDYLVIPRIQGSFARTSISLAGFLSKMKKPWLSKIEGFPLTRDTVWMLGLYVAEGSNTDHNRTRDIVFSISAQETDIANRLHGILSALELPYHTMIRGNKMWVVTCSLALGLALDAWCGRGAENKRVPEFLLYHKDKRLLKSFLAGYMKGDGAREQKPHRTKNVRPLIEGVTTSRTLAMQIQLAYARLGNFLSLYAREAKTVKIQGRLTEQKEQFIFVLRDHATRHRHVVSERAILVPVTSLERVPYTGTVHNIETSDNSYVAGNVVVHNCVNVKKLDDGEAIERIRRFVAAAGETSAMRRFIEYNVRRARRNGLLPPTLSTLKKEHPDIYWLLPKEVLAEEAVKGKSSQ